MADTLSAGESLSVGNSLQSQNRRFSLVMEADGNLVLYQGAPSIESAMWSTQTGGIDVLWRPTRLVMQEDGNLVLYSNYDIPAWDTTTNGALAASLVLQDDGNLVISGQADGLYAYGVGGAVQEAVVWESKTTVPEEDPLAADVGSLWFDTGDVSVVDGKHMQSYGWLYRNGLLSGSTYTRTVWAFVGLRGQVFVTCVDAGGRAVWVSQVKTMPTRCGTWDPTCGSNGTTPWDETFPEEIAQVTVRVDIRQADIDVYAAERLRNWVCRIIKGSAPFLAGLGPEYAVIAGLIGDVLECPDE
jgi:hypothetical protein